MNAEDQIHMACVDLLTLRRILHFHVPNASKGPIAWRAKLKRMGLLAGVPDLVLVLENEIVFVEIKTETGRLSPAQRWFRDKVQEFGHLWYLVRSVEEMDQVLKTLRS